MYRINPHSNRITALKKISFSEQGFTERAHLQEWLANQPDALGEELLIIQKEFDGFDDTRERLDLLALDKSGALVIIENKLDDSGRDVVWQALKYAAYCSTLSKTQVADVYQRFLDKQGGGLDAKRQICEFLGTEEFDEVALNHGIDQRLIMVAAEFRKEVTSAAIWLLKHGVRVQCFKATPYQDGADLFLSIDQLIPLPEAEELMIGIAEKEVEEQTVERSRTKRHQLRVDFWYQTLEALERANVKLYANVSPRHDHWLDVSSGLSGVAYSMVLNRDEVRMDFCLDRPSKEQNKMLFDLLHARADEFTAAYGMPLAWRRMDDKKVSIIEASCPCAGHDRQNWPTMIDWFVDQVQRMVRVFGPEVPRLKAALKAPPDIAAQMD